MKARQLGEWVLFVLLIAVICAQAVSDPALGQGFFDISLGLIIALGLARVLEGEP